jgi:hypothetical protein
VLFAGIALRGVSSAESGEGCAAFTAKLELSNIWRVA